MTSAELSVGDRVRMRGFAMAGTVVNVGKRRRLVMSDGVSHYFVTIKWDSGSMKSHANGGIEKLPDVLQVSAESISAVTEAVRAHRAALRAFDMACLRSDFDAATSEKSRKLSESSWAFERAILAARDAGAVLAEVVAAYDAGVREEAGK